MDKATEFLQAIFEKMGVEAETSSSLEEDYLAIEVSGKDAGLLIGHQGETLEALQCVLNAVVNKGAAERQRVVLDVEGYRRHQTKNLEDLARRMAEKAVREGSPVSLRPMKAFERRTIHLALQDYPEVETSSEGEEPFRRVTISPRSKSPEQEG